MSEQHVVYKFQPDQTKSNLHKVIYIYMCVSVCVCVCDHEIYNERI
jgi:hypothetical protein